MRLDDERESGNVEDRRGQSWGGGGGVRLPHVGIGTLLVALVASYFLGVNPLTILSLLSGGGGPAQLGIAIGEAYMGISTTGSMLSMVQARRIRALAVGRATRLTDNPDIPTFAEAGMPGYDTNTWYSMHAPAGTPDAIADKLNRELVRILGLPDIKERLRHLSSDGVGYTRQQTAVFVQNEITKYAKVIKDAGIKGE